MDVSAKIITQFVKDLSFENPMGPGAFQKGSERPAINANVDVKAANRKDTDIYEVELNINISAKLEDKNVYIIDLKYVGLFEIKNLTEDIKEAYLSVSYTHLTLPTILLV